MTKTLPAFIFLVFATAFSAKAQIYYGDSVISLIHINFANDSASNIIPDTAASPLWQYGTTHKAFFATDTTGTVAMMTDTVATYPINANNFFVLKVNNYNNPIINFWHRYQTTAQHDGGIVDFSLDNGITWNNILSPCGGTISPFGIRTNNFYSLTDTLLTGEPAFSGTSDSMVYSQFQFFGFLPEKLTTDTVGCNFYSVGTIYVRFRFESDSTADSLAGWIIDSMQIEYDDYGTGGVANVNKYKALNVFPNPSYEGVYNFPALANEQQYSIEVYDAMGSKLLTLPYNHALNISKYARGIYFYKVTNGAEYYSGRLLFD